MSPPRCTEWPTTNRLAPLGSAASRSPARPAPHHAPPHPASALFSHLGRFASKQESKESHLKHSAGNVPKGGSNLRHAAQRNRGRGPSPSTPRKLPPSQLLAAASHGPTAGSPLPTAAAPGPAHPLMASPTPPPTLLSRPRPPLPLVNARIWGAQGDPAVLEPARERGATEGRGNERRGHLTYPRQGRRGRRWRAPGLPPPPWRSLVL